MAVLLELFCFLAARIRRYTSLIHVSLRNSGAFLTGASAILYPCRQDPEPALMHNVLLFSYRFNFLTTTSQIF